MKFKNDYGGFLLAHTLAEIWMRNEVKDTDIQEWKRKTLVILSTIFSETMTYKIEEFIG